LITPDQFGDRYRIETGEQAEDTKVEPLDIPIGDAQGLLCADDRLVPSKNTALSGGWIARTDPAGNHWELLCGRLRNPYDLAFNLDGELFP